jgi:hypothetical protein
MIAVLLEVDPGGNGHANPKAPSSQASVSKNSASDGLT